MQVQTQENRSLLAATGEFVDRSVTIQDLVAGGTGAFLAHMGKEAAEDFIGFTFPPGVFEAVGGVLGAGGVRLVRYWWTKPEEAEQAIREAAPAVANQIVTKMEEKLSEVMAGVRSIEAAQADLTHQVNKTSETAAEALKAAKRRPVASSRKAPPKPRSKTKSA